MTDIALQQISPGVFGLALNGNDLAADDGLETSVLISLFTDARATPEELAAIGHDDPRGWWGDIGDDDGVQMGSKLWLLWREVIVTETLSRAREYCRDALRWMIDDGIAKAVNVVTERGGLYQISIGIEIIRPDDTVVRYTYLWNGQGAKR